jgi:transketolase
MTDLQRSRQAGSRCTGHPGGTCSSARTGAYRDHLLPAAVTTCLAVEAAALGWYRHVVYRGIES